MPTPPMRQSQNRLTLQFPTLSGIEGYCTGYRAIGCKAAVNTQNCYSRAIYPLGSGNPKCLSSQFIVRVTEPHT
jgi:hypothetical protein